VRSSRNGAEIANHTIDVTKPYIFIGLGAIDVTKPYKFIGFDAIDVTKPHKFMWFGAIDVAVKNGSASQKTHLLRITRGRPYMANPRNYGHCRGHAMSCANDPAHSMLGARFGGPRGAEPSSRTLCATLLLGTYFDVPPNPIKLKGLVTSMAQNPINSQGLVTSMAPNTINS
jgi:hypothetical protein